MENQFEQELETNPMIGSVQRAIEHQWHRGPDFWFVFPSEAVAWAWAKHMARAGTVGTISINRFLSWDTFKERVFRGQEERKPANSFFRSLFLEEFLQQNAKNARLIQDSSISDNSKNPSTKMGSTISGSSVGATPPHPTRPLQRLLPPAYAKDYGGFITSFTRILPGLKPLFEPVVDSLEHQNSQDPGSQSGTLGIDRIRHTGNQEVWDDYQILYQGYKAFLDHHGYYEPRWIFKAPSNPQAQGLVFFPELLDDWEEFGPTVEKLPGIRLVTLAETATKSREDHQVSTVPELLCASNQAEEVGSLFDWLEGHLATGVRPGEIVLTLGDYDTILPLVEREARIRGIPLEGRRGRPLSEFPGPGLFQLLSTLESDNYSYKALEQLFCSLAYPLTDQAQELGRRILTIGLRRELSFPSKDFWLRELQSPKTQDERDFFQKLVTVVEQLTRAKHLKSLQGLISQALDLLTGGSWQGLNTGALQRARELLQGLVETEETVGISPAQPFRFWLNQLDQQVYVPQGRKGVVEVYPYRVTAGMPAKVHGLVNLNQSAVQVVTGGLHFLREDQRELLGTGMYRSRTGDFLRAYSQSGVALRMSANSLTTDGAKIPATWFLQEGKQVPIRWDREALNSFAQDRLTQEPFTHGHLSQQPLAQALGQNRWDRLAKGPSRSSLDSWDPELSVQAVLENNQKGHQTDHQGWRISNKQFQSFLSCPLEFVGRNLLGIRSQIEYPEFMSPKSQGILYHRILEKLFTLLAKQNQGVLSQEALTEGALSPDQIQQTTWEQTSKLYPKEIVDLVAPGVVANIQELLEVLTDNLHNPQMYSREETWVRSTGLTLDSACSDSTFSVPRDGGRATTDQPASQDLDFGQDSGQTSEPVEIYLSGIIDGVLALGELPESGVEGQDPDDLLKAQSNRWLILDFKRTKGTNRSPGQIYRWAIGINPGDDEEVDGSTRDEFEDGYGDGEHDGDDSQNSTTDVQLQLLFYSLLVAPAQELTCGEAQVETTIEATAVKDRNSTKTLEKTYTPPRILPESLSGLWYGLYLPPKTKGKAKADSRIVPVYSAYADGKKKKSRSLEGTEELVQGQTRIMEQVERLVQAVQTGIYAEPQGGCPGCPFRGLCRTKFSLQLR